MDSNDIERERGITNPLQEYVPSPNNGVKINYYRYSGTWLTSVEK